MHLSVLSYYAFCVFKVFFILVCKIHIWPKKKWTPYFFHFFLDKVSKNPYHLLLTKNSHGSPKLNKWNPTTPLYLEKFRCILFAGCRLMQGVQVSIFLLTYRGEHILLTMSHGLQTSSKYRLHYCWSRVVSFLCIVVVVFFLRINFEWVWVSFELGSWEVWFGKLGSWKIVRQRPLLC